MRIRPIGSVLITVAFAATSWAGTDVRELGIRHAIGAGHYREAFDQVAVIVAASDDRDRFYDLLAEAGQYAGRVREADSLLAMCARRGWGVSRALVAQGWLDAHRAAWFEAYTHYQAAMHLGGPTVRAVAGIQEMHEKLHGREASISHLLALGHARQRTAAVWYALALAYWSQWDLAQASFAIDRSLRSGIEDPGVGHLDLVIRSSQDPGARNRGHLAIAYRDAVRHGDWEGVAFLAWGRMNAFDAVDSPDSSEQIRRDALRFTQELGLIGWHGQFLLEEGRIAFARGDGRGALCMTDSAMSCFRSAGDFDGILAAYALRLSLLLESFRVPEALDCCFRMLTQIDGRCDARLYAGAAIDAGWILSRLGGQRIALVLGIHAESILEHMLYATHDRCRLSSMLATVHASLGDTTLAARYARTAWELACSPGGSEELRANCEGVLGDLARSRGDLRGARRHYVAQWDRASRTWNLGERKSAALALARLASAARQRHEVGRWVDSTMVLARLTGDPRAEAEAHLLRGLQAEFGRDTVGARVAFRAARTSLHSLQRVQEICSLTREMREWYIAQNMEVAQALVRVGEIVPAAGLIARARSDVWESRQGTPLGARDVQRRTLSSVLHRWILRAPLEESAGSDTAIAAMGSFFASLIHPGSSQDLSGDGHAYASVPDSTISATVRRAIHEREVVVDMCPGQERLDVLIMTRDTIVSCRMAHGKVDQQELESRNWFQPAVGLLLRVADRRDHLVVVGDGIQRQTLFEAMPLGESRADGLITDLFAVSYRPFLPLEPRRIPPDASGRRSILVVGGPATAPGADPSAESALIGGESGGGMDGLGSLPGSWKEIDFLRSRFGDGIDVLLGTQASKKNFCALAPSYAIVHVAAHGVSRTEGESGHHVMLSPSDGEDGKLSIEDIVTLDLRSTMVILPACLSARASATGDMESLAEAFLRAGAPSVLAARYAVDDELSVEFLDAFYAGLERGATGGMAVRNAMRSMIARGYHAPAVWAGFQLYGDGTVTPGKDLVTGGKGSGRWPVGTAALTLISILAWFGWKRVRRSVASHPHGEGSEGES